MILDNVTIGVGIRIGVGIGVEIEIHRVTMVLKCEVKNSLNNRSDEVNVFR